MSLKAISETNLDVRQFNDCSKKKTTDPWGCVSGDRGKGRNPWVGAYDRRRNSRDPEAIDVGDFDFAKKQSKVSSIKTN